jgi:23S rRNA-/tRNA-specific pseudouridylate synthase
LVGRQGKASHGVRPGDVVSCAVLPPPPLEAAPEPLPLDIVYEDEHLIVINKVRSARLTSAQSGRRLFSRVRCLRPREPVWAVAHLAGSLQLAPERGP